MLQLGRATCPQLARAAGVSLVTVHKEVREMEGRGEVREAGREVRGGRPSPVYEYEEEYAARVYVQMRREQGVTHVEVERWDMLGALQERSGGRYAAVEDESLDGRMEELLGGRRVRGVSIWCSPSLRRAGLCEHLSRRFRCPAVYLNAAAALAPSGEGGVTLYLARGEAPQGCVWRQGRMEELGRLDWLALPADWERMDYSDHTLVEEMVSRLLQTLSCVLAPDSVSLYSDFWGSRLMERIRFNTQSKLRGSAPSLRFGACSSRALDQALRRAARSVGDSEDGYPLTS